MGRNSLCVDTNRMSPELSVTCKRCGRRTPSALQVEPRTFADLRLETNRESCDRCGFADRYSRDDFYYYFPDEVGQPG
jgi:hypothetical protein